MNARGFMRTSRSQSLMSKTNLYIYIDNEELKVSRRKKTYTQCSVLQQKKNVRANPDLVRLLLFKIAIGRIPVRLKENL